MDFLIIGAMKSGTSTLWALMRDHPDIWVPMPKELPFFSSPDHHRGWDEYARRNLREAPANATIGKATPAYMAGIPVDGVSRDDTEREIPERIAREFPEIKLIAILRDPIERALSHYAMSRNVGAETREAETAFEELLRPEVLADSRRDPHRLQGYVVLGEYGRILRGYLDVFDASQLLVLSIDELSSDPTSLLAKVWPFVGVGDHLPADLHARYMASGGLTRRHRLVGLLDGRRPAVRAVRRAARTLPPAIGGPLRRFVWTRLLGTVASGEGKESTPPPQLSPELRQRLVAHYEPDSAELERAFGWSPLRGGRPQAPSPTLVSRDPPPAAPR